jgi:midasin (ATPase involved in ribosome maturation)
VFKILASQEATPLPLQCRKMLCLGLCSFLTVPLQQLPLIVQQNMSVVLSNIVTLLQKITADRAAAAAADAEAAAAAALDSGGANGRANGHSDVDSDVDDDEGYENEHECTDDQDIAAVHTEDAQYLQQLHAVSYTAAESGIITSVG